MIITKQKPFEVILKELEDVKSVFLVGCGECATDCQTGGEEQVKEMAEKLTAEGKVVTGNVVPEVGCQELDVQREFRAHKDEIEKADSILVMSCGAGVQSVRSATEKQIFPSN